METQIPINMSGDTIKGSYANLMVVNHSSEEFCIDFMNVFPPAGALTARIVTSPGHLKRMIEALQQNMEKYEQQFGDTPPAPEPPKPEIGFKSN